MSFNIGIAYLKWSDILKLANEVKFSLLEIFRCALHLFKHSARVLHLKGHPIHTINSPSFHASQVSVASQPLSFHIGHRCKTEPWILGESVVLVKYSLLEEFLGRQFFRLLIILAVFSIRK